MKNASLYLYIFFTLFLTSGVFADESVSSILPSEEVTPKQTTEGLYAQALSLYLDHQYEMASEEFLKVQGIDPNYKSTQYYLNLIDNKLKETQAKDQQILSDADHMLGITSSPIPIVRTMSPPVEITPPQVKENVAVTNQSPPIFIVKPLPSPVEVAPLKPVQSPVKVISPQAKENVVVATNQQAVEKESPQQADKEHQDEINKQTQEIYAQAVTLYHHKEFIEAKKDFEEAQSLVADYKDTKWFLHRIDRIIQKEYDRAIEKQRRILQEQRRQEDWEYKKKITQLKELLESQKAAQEEALRQKELDQQRQQAQELKDKRANASQQSAVMPNVKAMPLLADPSESTPGNSRQDQNRLFSEAVTYYKYKKYAEAGFLFDELVNWGYPRAQVWLEKVERSFIQSEKEKDNLRQELPFTDVEPVTEAQPVVVKSEPEVSLKPKVTPEGEQNNKGYLVKQQYQAQIEAQQELIRKQIEDGVEGLYQEALSLFQQGDYANAADRFKDIQDLLPGYKQSEQYIQEAHLKSVSVKSQVPTVQPNVK